MSSATQRVAELLCACGTEHGVLPPTALYNEGWMLRLVLDWFSRDPAVGHPLSFAPSARWYSEALLPSQFLARTRGDLLGEGWTHADGVIGHFEVRKGRGDVQLAPAARQFVVTEAKLFSGFSPGTKRARSYDQAARTVACIAEVLHRGGHDPTAFDQLGFVVLAPEELIAHSGLRTLCEKDGIAERVRQRVFSYEGMKEKWYEESFLPLLAQLDIRVLSWEEVVEAIRTSKPDDGADLWHFLQRCIAFNRPAPPATGHSSSR
jgi:hypothetical protein